MFHVDKLLNQFANPNLHDVPSNLQIRVELWDRYNKHSLLGHRGHAEHSDRKMRFSTLRCQCIRKSVCYSAGVVV